MHYLDIHPLNRMSRLVSAAGLSMCLLLSASAVHTQEEIPRSMLVDMARSQYSVLCQTETFVSCMGFTAQSCNDLSETAITQCLLPLPEQIALDKLDNSALESCPKGIFADAGFSEEKAGACFDKAMKQAGG